MSPTDRSALYQGHTLLSDDDPAHCPCSQGWPGDQVLAHGRSPPLLLERKLAAQLSLLAHGCGGANSAHVGEDTPWGSAFSASGGDQQHQHHLGTCQKANSRAPPQHDSIRNRGLEPVFSHVLQVILMRGYLSHQEEGLGSLQDPWEKGCQEPFEPLCLELELIHRITIQLRT